MTLYAQWVLYPFSSPQTSQQKSANSKWALAKAKEALTSNSIDANGLKLILQYNGEILIEVFHPGLKDGKGKEFWEDVLSALKKSEGLVSISVYVNNDISEKIAINLAERVPHPWHIEYQGRNSNTLIYHK